MRSPFLADAASGESLIQSITAASRAAVVTPSRVASLLSYFLERVALEVSRGSTVRLRGYGYFFAVRDERPTAAALSRYPTLRPEFRPAQCLRDRVRNTAPANRLGKRAIGRHRRNHSTWRSRPYCHSRVFSAMEAWRAQIRAQAPWEFE